MLDASAVLAWLREEPGADVVAERLVGSHVSAVNLSEVLQKSLVSGADADGLAEDLLVVGLGVADRACLATAVVLGGPALTADRAWAGIEREGLSVELIR